MFGHPRFSKSQNYLKNPATRPGEASETNARTFGNTEACLSRNVTRVRALILYFLSVHTRGVIDRVGGYANNEAWLKQRLILKI